MLKVEKKQVKMVAVAVAAVFLLGIVGIAVSQSDKSFAAASPSNVGVINWQMAVSQHPDMAKANDALKAELDQAQKDFETKTASMNEQDKKAYYVQTQQRLDAKNRELMTPILDKVTAAVKTVAEAKGLTIVVDKNAVVYGGQDITDEVVKSYSGK